ncbi:hypothetical protein BWQ96_00760 [Gracilariopsis chorda]|uniref:PRP1 splicing factor N-terminal domain-containing protein n=1 Tax=Gracilariopsis chorda TaxID=448386 RepID=A0A2V3J506_9FLOR|nr:hypothetical protein BWQ96_00760 [Gracilariopsis chorda]|eukprot:PXF49444.1 hypothetical protein BWQ96_00760 [Gracilariopsis chorda]
MNSSQPTGQSTRRVLGDARRETTAAEYIAASKRRRLGVSEDISFDEEDDEKNPTDTRALDDNDVAVFADAVYEEDDAEADEIYAQVEERMRSRRQKQREEKLHAELKKYSDANPTVRQQFADLKAELKTVSTDEWACIPDIGDRSIKKQKVERFTPVPDSVLSGSGGQKVGYIATESDGEEDATDLAAIGQGRSGVLGQNLDRAGDIVAEKAAVDADNYLSELAGIKVSADSEIGDVKRARRLLESINETNPGHAPGWIAAARLEESIGKISAARMKILEGCRRCAKEEEVWIEAARMHCRKTARRLLAQGVKHVPRSTKMWLHAAGLETDVSAKKLVLRKGLEVIPRSVELWKGAVELEDEFGARLLLRKAVECVPQEVDMWIALSRVERYDRAKEVLQRARKVVGRDAKMWISWAEMEEAEHGEDSELMDMVMKEAVGQVDASREEWLNDAVEVEKVGYVGTVRAMVSNTIGIGVKEGSRESQWVEDANEMEGKGHKMVSRAIYWHLTRVFSESEEAWAAFGDFERRCGEEERAKAVLQEGIEKCKGTTTLWLMLAKDRWRTEGAEGGREVLRKALEVAAEKEEMWVAAAKIETECGQLERARDILRKAREEAIENGGVPSARVLMKSALVEREDGKWREEREVVEGGLRAHGSAEKLWLMLAQWYEEAEGRGWMREGMRFKDAGGVYGEAVERCAESAAVWIGFARWEEGRGGVARARAILERGRGRVGGGEGVEAVWSECVRLETRAGGREGGRAAVSRALAECGKSGRLWAAAIALEERASARGRCVDALRVCGESAAVLSEVGKVLWRSGRAERARQWLWRAARAEGGRSGDSWAALLAFEEHARGRGRGRVAEVERLALGALAARGLRGALWSALAKRRGHERWGALRVLRAAAQQVRRLLHARVPYIP